MGIVYLCFDREEQRPVALKTFKPQFLSDRATRDRFLREGTTWVDLGRHPHIVRCHDVTKPGGLEVYLVLELVAKEEGHSDASLRSWLMLGQPMAVEQALLFGLQIARAMQHATATLPGLVHRDLKPENILIGRDHLPDADINRLRVTDFGLAATLQEAPDQWPAGYEKSADFEESLSRTQLTRGIVGTPLYMAPEQWTGEDVNVQTDMYALGCILYEMLSGKRVATGETMAALQRSHLEGNLRPLPDALPGEVSAIVTRSLTVEPGVRYANWDAVHEALALACASVTGHAAPQPESAQARPRTVFHCSGWRNGELPSSA